MKDQKILEETHPKNPRRLYKEHWGTDESILLPSDKATQEPCQAYQELAALNTHGKGDLILLTDHINMCKTYHVKFYKGRYSVDLKILVYESGQFPLCYGSLMVSGSLYHVQFNI